MCWSQSAVAMHEILPRAYGYKKGATGITTLCRCAIGLLHRRLSADALTRAIQCRPGCRELTLHGLWTGSTVDISMR